MAVVKIIELVGSSTKSTDDAAQQALKQAQSSLRNIRALDIVSTGIRGENLDEFRAHVRVAFDAERLTGPLMVRGRRRGDRFLPFGAEGERRLKTLLIDNPARLLPLALDASPLERAELRAEQA